jgi:hypothetical protein
MGARPRRRPVKFALDLLERWSGWVLKFVTVGILINNPDSIPAGVNFIGGLSAAQASLKIYY